MLVNGDTNKFKVTNPVSLNKKQSHPSFSGHSLAQDEQGRDLYRFYLPNSPKAKVELALLNRLENGSFQVVSKKVRQEELKNGIFEIRADEILHNPNYTLGYRFMLDGAVGPYFDNTAKNNYDDNDKSKMFNVALAPYRANQALPRQMLHLFPDSVLDETSNEKRNHFNHLGGNLKTVINRIDLFKDFGINRILGTPIFGQDTVSSHGYWTSNGYQVTDTMGDLGDFKKLQTKLFQNSMGWVADGAFVNEGLQGVHLKDVMTWGEKSPFINMFDTTNVENKGLKFGILSKQPEVNEHVRFKLINAPYEIEYEKTKEGFKEKSVKKVDYDINKPTYLQIFDERLVTDAQVKQDSPFQVYGKKNADDKHEINNYKDSIQPYSFRISPRDVRHNYEKYEEALKIKKNEKKDPSKIEKKTEFKNYLTAWTNFEIVPSNEDGSVALWVGNSDIAKRRFMIPESVINSAKTDKKDELIASQYQVQDDVIQIGKFWTSEVSRTLVSYTAELLGQKVAKGASYEEAVKELIDAKMIPSSASSILEKSKDNNKTSALYNILSANPTTGKRAYALKPVKMPVNVTDGLMDYPLDAIEFSPDLSSILAYPYLKNYAVTPETVGKSRYELYSMKDSFYNTMPADFRALYKNTDDFIADKKTGLTALATDLLKEAGKQAGFDVVDANGELTDEGKEIYPLFAADIAKFLYVSSIANGIRPEYTIGETGLTEFGYNKELLKNISIESLGLQFVDSPKDAAAKMLSLLKDGAKKIPQDTKTEFVNFLAQRMENIDSDAINAARLIIERSESGLDWRIDAAKDIGDWDSVEAGRFDRSECLDKFSEFWHHFNKGVRQYNPKAYTIGELTDLAGPFEKSFASRTGFTTQSNYNNLFSNPQALYGSNAEKPEHLDDIASNTKSNIMSFLFSGMSDSVNFAHTFTGNHDKPRILHTMAVDMNTFGQNKTDAVKSIMYESIKGEDFQKVLGKYTTILQRAIDDTANGEYFYKNAPKRFDGEEFAVRPYDLTIDDIFDYAAAKDHSFERLKDTNPKQIETAKALMLNSILKPAMTKYTSILFYQVGMPGAPTVYAGDELGETGWETLAKNEKQNNRNRLHFERLDDPNYDFVKEYRNNLSNIMKIRNQKGGSALVNGNTLILASQKLESQKGEAAVIYRYNDKTDAVCIFHNQGYGYEPKAAGSDESVKEIYLDQFGQDTGLANGLKPDTLYYDALNPKNEYKAVFDSKEKKYKLINNNGGNIPLGNRGLILLRKFSFDGKECYVEQKNGKASPTFRGKYVNPHVQLANLKYNSADLVKK